MAISPLDDKNGVAMTAQEQKELLLRVTRGLAEAQLKGGGIFPFGATLGTGRDVTMLAPKSVKKDVSIEEVSRHFSKLIAEAAAKTQLVAACYCADVRMTSTTGTLAPALFIHIEQPNGTSEDFAYPYAVGADSKMVFGEPTVVDAHREIFP